MVSQQVFLIFKERLMAKEEGMCICLWYKHMSTSINFWHWKFGIREKINHLVVDWGKEI